MRLLRVLTLPLCFAAALWIGLIGPAAATSCRKSPDAELPLTAAEQALLDQHQLAVQRARADFEAELSADPLLGPMAQAWSELEALAETPGQALPQSFRKLMQREELAALLFEAYRFSEPDAFELDTRAAEEWRPGAPVWSLLEARQLEMAGQHDAANQAIRRYLARAAEVGRLNLRARRLGFRLIGLDHRHPEPEKPLPERTSVGCGFGRAIIAALVQSMFLGLAHEPEGLLAWVLVADDKEMIAGRLCAIPWPGGGGDSGDPIEATDTDPQQSPERLQLCEQLGEHLRQRAPLIAVLFGDDDNDFGDRCTEAIETAAAAPDWRAALDRLAMTGCDSKPLSDQRAD